jgi:hypothetical protein
MDDSVTKEDQGDHEDQRLKWTKKIMTRSLVEFRQEYSWTYRAPPDIGRLLGWGNTRSCSPRQTDEENAQRLRVALHGRKSDTSSSRALASFRSAVSKPSVNRRDYRTAAAGTAQSY